MKRLIGIAVAAVVAAGCAAAPAPTPQIITKTVEVPGPQPTPQIITKTVTVKVTPEVCLDALDAADDANSLFIDAALAALDMDFDTLDILLNEDGKSGTLNKAMTKYLDLADECRSAAQVGS